MMNVFCEHEWTESYYGYDCTKCGAFVAFGCEPWAPIDDDANFDDGEPYQDEYDDEDEDEWLYRCGWVRGQGCTLAGTEECDFECTLRDGNYRGLALTQARLAKRAKAKSDQ